MSPSLPHIALRILTLCVAVIIAHLPAYADRPVTGLYAIEIGGRSAVAEYISPAAYHGTDIAISGLWTKALPFSEDHAMMAFNARAAYTSMLNPAGSASVFGVDARFSWQMRWYTRLPHNLTVSVGGGPAINAGALALLRNSNNPVDVTIKAAIEAGASLSWRSRIARVPIVLEDRLSTPLFGAFFMPEYGEPFYEIYLGNRRGLAHFGWPGNFPGLDNTVSLTLDLGKTALQIGYRLGIDTAYANHLSTRSITNSFVIGIIPDGLGIKRKRDHTEIRPF